MDEPTVRPLESDDFEQLREIRRFAFLDDVDYSRPELEQAFHEYLNHMTGVFVDGEMAAAGAMLPFRMFYGGEPVPVGGLASVVSAAATRRRGHVRVLLEAMLEDARDDGVGWCLEYPFDTRYYAKYGWQTIANGSFLEVPSEWFPNRGPVDGVRRIDDPEQAGEELHGIYEKWAPNFNFTMTRDGNARDDWSHILVGSARRPKTDTRFAFAIDDVAYCVLYVRHIDNRQQMARVLDWGYATPEGRRRLLRFLGTLSGQIDTFEIQIPDDDPLSLDLGGFKVANPHPVQLRIVDVETALSGASCTKAVDVVVEVEDSFCQWNDDRFRLRTDSDGALQVHRVDEPADVTLTVGTLALVASGSPVGTGRVGLTDGDEAAVQQLGRIADRPAYVPLGDYF